MKTKQNGVALVEFALILPLLLLLIFITADFGRAMYEYNTITKSARDGVRYLSTKTPGNLAAIAEAKNLIVYGKVVIDGMDKPLALDLTIGKVNTTWSITGTNPVINTVKVTVSGYTFTPMFSSVFGLAFGNANGEIPFGDITATMRSSL